MPTDQAAATAGASASADQTEVLPPALLAELAPMTRDLPERVGKYRLDALIGRGAAGLVLLGYDEDLDRPVAVKTVDLSASAPAHRQAALAAASAEARAAGRFIHTNIVAVFDYLEEDGRPYIVMEHAPGASLAAALRAGRPMAPAQVGEIVAQILFALDHAHAKGVVHRDLKPANVLVATETSVKVGDFGLAALTAGVGPARALRIVGTPRYMAPEQFAGLPPDPRADLFAAGVTLYELLSHRRPFKADDLDTLRAAVSEGRATPIETFRPDLPEAARAVVMRALQPDPEARFPNAARFADAVVAAFSAAEAGGLRPYNLLALAPPPKPLPLEALRDAAPRAAGPPKPTPARRAAAPAPAPPLPAQPVDVDAALRAAAEAIGPIARLLRPQAAAALQGADAARAAEILALAAREIVDPTSAERVRDHVAALATSPRRGERAAAGRNSAGPAQTAGAAPESVRPQDIAAATKALTALIGPIARLSVREAAEAAADRAEFRRRVVDAAPQGDRARLAAALHETEG